MDQRKVPTQQEIQEDLRQYIEEKYGGKVAFAEPDYVGSKEGQQTEDKGDLNDVRFDLKPEELEEYLKMYIVGQEDAISIMATKICTHFHRMKYERDHPKDEEIVGSIKSNILLIGPTGVGKTYIVKLIAHKIGVPFVKGDATKFSETGYVGGDVEDMVRDLVAEADGNMKLAEYGIIYIDEIDKIAASQGHWGPDVSRTGVQRNLLKLMEETEVDLKVPHDLASQMEAVMETQRTGKAPRKKINTKNILFIVSGAFTQLEQIVHKRIKTNKIGFSGEQSPTVTTEQILEHATTEDLIQYGFESEFVGRLPIIGLLKDLGVDGLYRIMQNPKSSVISGKKRDFLAYGIQLEFEDEALREIAERADKEKTGARGLVSVMEKVLLPFEKKLPSTSIRQLVVNKEMVEDPQKALMRILFDHEVADFQRNFLTETGIVLEFTPEANEYLRDNFKNPSEIGKFLQRNFKDYGYGLKLAGKESFKVTKKVLSAPGVFLNSLIKQSYKTGKD